MARQCLWSSAEATGFRRIPAYPHRYHKRAERRSQCYHTSLVTGLSDGRCPIDSCALRRRESRALAVVAVILVALGLLPAEAAAQDQGELISLYQKAGAAQQAGDLAAAAALYEKIVTLSPDLAEAHANLGSIYYEMKDDSRAIASLERAIKLKPSLAAPHFFSGVIASRQREYPVAIRRLETAAKLDDSNPVVQVYLGAAYFAVREYSKAARAFEQATSLPEFQTDAFYHLSKAYSAISKEVMADLARRNPDSYHFHLARARFYESRRSWQEALDAYEAALGKHPDAPGLAARYEWVRGQMDGQAEAPPPVEEGPTLLGFLYDPPPDDAIEALFAEKRKQLERSASGLTDETALYRKAEDYQIASYLAARWISANDPGSYRGHQLKAQLHESRGEIDDAIREYGEAIALKPDLQNVHFAAGSLYWSASRFEEALVELRAELAVNPNHPEAHYEIADILRTLGRDGEAKTHLLECLRLEPNMLDAHLAIEGIYSSAGEYEKALAQMQQAAAIAPLDPTPHYRMASIYRKLGKMDEAREALERFRKLKTP